ncbi:DUF1253-domain-containing protein [Delitschia confertaspora ATCC 74209]|uniref:U3 small nucleolar RNA-associated protein 25 n=1 Tax=Delitschia confertaspora ATCC 74209 TaxID=1513339 RepID=A0A9P4MTW3_9PLEO|nr:DUF1253-domain-containing protein [Delitschia confertaspora ATCC 74209]
MSEEEVEQQPVRAFNALLEAFKQSESDSKPKKKRRKLEHSPDREESERLSPDLEEEDEAESGAVDEEDMNGAEDEDMDEDEDSTDPFEVHFANPEGNELSRRLKAIAKNQWTTKKIDTDAHSKCILQIPGTDEDAPPRRKIRSTKDLKLKNRLVETGEEILSSFSSSEQSIVPAIFNYQSVLYGSRTVKNAPRLRHIAALHALNHIFKTRDRIIKNNAKVSTAQDDSDAEYRDQGFTRPKVLILLETKQSCARFVQAMTEICHFEQQENKKRFLDSYYLPEEKFTDDKPEDFREIFEGNDENEFRIGLKFTRKTVKFFSKFYNSDFILASPLGLRRAIEAGGDPKKKDSDFLSSIELVIMDQADAIQMQNWEHVEYVFEHLNLQPKDAHGCDFSRVRNWYLDGQSKHLRQTLLFSAYITPEINNLFKVHMQNVSGRLKHHPDYTNTNILQTMPNLSIRQTFTRYDSPSILSDPDARFKFFTTAIVPMITKLPKPSDGKGGQGVLVFIPSYHDYTRIRNYFAASTATENISFGNMSEYVDPTSQRRARSHFMTGRHSVLLYTGRAHHFTRPQIRGVKRVVFYGVPENPIFYEEVVGFIGASLGRGEVEKRDTWVKALFSKYEALSLERVVGTERAKRMVGGRDDVFDFT